MFYPISSFTLVFIAAAMQGLQRIANAQRSWQNPLQPLRFRGRDSESPSSEEDRLAIYAVNNATIANISTRDELVNSAYIYLTDLSIQFETGPNLRELDVTALCVAAGSDCNGTPLGDGAVTVQLPKTIEKQTMEINITNIDVTNGEEDSQIDCFIRLTEQPGLLADRKPEICWDVDIPGQTEPCSGFVQAEGTQWVFSCGVTSCDDACASVGGTCNVDGMNQVTTEAQAIRLLELINQHPTILINQAELDGPVIDYYSPFRAEYYWPGTSSQCDTSAVTTVAQRICCCSLDLADCPV